MNVLILGATGMTFTLRPGLIIPMHGVKSKTRLYRAFYTVLGPLLPLMKRVFPRSIVTTEQLGRVMLRLARSGYGKPILETADLAALASGATPPEPRAR